MKDRILSILAMAIFLIGLSLILILPAPESPDEKENITGTVVSVRKAGDLTFLTISRDEHIDILVEGDLPLRRGDQIIVYEEDGFATSVIRLFSSDNT